MKSSDKELSDLKKDNLVAHKQEKAMDKVYMACLREEKDAQGNSKFIVIGKWGRRGYTLKSQVKWTGSDYRVSRDKQCELFRSKLAEGYIDIDSPEYARGKRNPVTRIESVIAASLELRSAKLLPSSRLDESVPLESDRMIKDGDEVTCINNAGIEDKFDLGVDYISEKHPDKQMIYVHDKNGVKGEFFVDRFKKV